MIEKLAALVVLGSVAAVPVLLGWYGSRHRPTAAPADACVVDLTGIARRGVWTLERVHNLDYWWKSFEPATIHLPLEANVVLRLHSADVLHQFYVPALRLGPIDVEPGHVAEVAFVADHEGVFQYHCTSLCGECHFYMTGWIVVTARGKVPASPKPIVCTLCGPDPPPPSEEGLVAYGEYLYRRRACGACHGPEGRGGVANYNYVNRTIIGHVHLAARLLLPDRESAARLVDWMASRQPSPPGSDPPDIRGFPVIQARLEAARALIREGKSAAKADRNGPDPPLHMPAWKHRLTEAEIDSLLAYLVSLDPWEEDEDERQSNVALHASE